MTKEALKMALEALEEPKEHFAKHRRLEAITAIKEALAQEQEPVTYSGNGTAGREADARPTGFFFQMPKPMTQPENEPVVWMYQDKSTHEVRFQKHMRGFVDHGATYETPLYTTPPPCPTCEALARTVMMDQTGRDAWVGLTDEEANELWESTDSDWELMKRIEAKLKHKNTRGQE